MPEKKKRSPKWAYGANSIVSTVIFLAILVLIVLIAERKPLRMDLTETRSFSLSGQTRNILNQIDKPIEVKVFISASGPSAQTKDKTKDLLDTYCYYNKNIKYEFIDPDSQPEITRKYEIKTYGTIVLEGYDKKQAVQTADEENITNALLKLTHKEQKKVYFLTGHGEHSFSSDARDSYSIAKSALEKNSYSIAEFNLLQHEDIPSDAAAVIIAGPQKQIPEREQQAIKNFLARGGKVMLMIDPLTHTGMQDFLKGYGIEIGQDVVIDRLSRLFGASERVPVIMEYGNHKITENFAQPTFFPDARSVVPSEKPPEGTQLEYPLLVRSGRKKFMDDGGRAFVAHFLIVGAVGQQKLLVVTQERRGFGAALIPYQNAPSLRPQNAGKFRAGARQVEPVRCLGGGDEVDGSGAQRGFLGCSGATDTSLPLDSKDWRDSSRRTPISRISVLGSTAKTEFPFSKRGG